MRRLADHHGSAVVFSWAPQALEEAVVGRSALISIVAVPSDLRRAFKRGNATEREDNAWLIVTEATTEEAEL